jgi:hypothetical protein
VECKLTNIIIYKQVVEEKSFQESGEWGVMCWETGRKSDLAELADGCAGLKIWYNGNGFYGRAGISGEGGWVRLA